MLTLLVFIAILAVLVLSHEWGHFIVARLNKIGVEEFGFGFPPRLIGIRRLKNKKGWEWVFGNKEVTPDPATLYSINLIPLGGFVRIKGEDGDADVAAEADSFVSKKPWQKASVLLAGVIMNALLAVILLSVAYMIGLPEALAPGQAVPAGANLQIVQVVAGMPAASAGIQPGDVIEQVDNLQHPTVTDLQQYVETHKNSLISLTFERGQQLLTVKLHPAIYPDTGKGGIGVALTEVVMLRYPWYQAAYHGTITTGVYFKETILAFWYLIKGLFSGVGVASEVSGPVGVAVMTGEAVHLGAVYVLQFMALLSLNLAILNALPIPALDGGRLLFVIINKIRRQAVAARTERLVHAISFAVLMLLVLAITIHDVGTFHSEILAWFKRVL